MDGNDQQIDDYETVWEFDRRAFVDCADDELKRFVEVAVPKAVGDHAYSDHNINELRRAYHGSLGRGCVSKPVVQIGAL